MRLQYIFAHVEDRINACRVVVETPEGKRPLGRPRQHRHEVK
jgi:hypothetical protein